MFDAIFVGGANLDHIAIVDKIPGSDERTICEPILTLGGGPAATAAVAAARQGLSVAFFGAVGDDANGRMVRKLLADESVDVEGLITVPEIKTPESILLIEKHSGLRTIVTEAAPNPVLSPSGLPASKWVHVDQTGFQAVKDLADRGKLHAKMSVDGGNPITELSLESVALYAPTERQLAARYAGLTLEDAMAQARVDGAREIVVTSGSEGAYYLSESGYGHAPAFPVDIVSTLGAGDVFHGVLVAALVRNMGLADAVSFSAAAAALSCQAIDGRSGIPNRTETLDFLDSNGPKSGARFPPKNN
jgi:sugar/nucleoside kinase (ribokinase family)